jgi:hypothetical protein
MRTESAWLFSRLSAPSSGMMALTGIVFAIGRGGSSSGIAAIMTGPRIVLLPAASRRLVNPSQIAGHMQMHGILVAEPLAWLAGRQTGQTPLQS